VPNFPEIQEYWDEYASANHFHGIEWGSPKFFQKLKEDHDQAFARSNELLNIPEHKGKSILDIYCGIGTDALELARHGVKVTFISPSPKCIELTKRYFTYNNLPVTVGVGNVEDLPFQSNLFDAVTARGILMFTPNIKQALGEIQRVLKPRGELYAHLHNKYSWYAFLAKISGINLVYERRDPPVHNLHSIADAKRIFQAFSSFEISLDRYPLKTSNRSGVLPKLYNYAFLPFASSVPKSVMRHLGYYIIIKAVK
jgi:ubiquinone/menaquinone biosynthesis C-methylase UbiE